MSLVLLHGTAAAQAPRSTGLIFLDPVAYNAIPPAPPPLKGPPPAVVDLSDYGYFPEPGNQGDQRSCVGWAVGYGMMSYYKNREFRLQKLQSDFRFSPAFIYNQIKHKNCNGGSLIRDALNVIESQGLLPIEDFKYDPNSCADHPSVAQIQSAWNYRIGRWMRVNVQSLAEMKAHIVRGFPVVIGMNVYSSFQDWGGGGVYKTSIEDAGKPLGGHAMVVVGYAEQLKAFKVLNSWGTSWGDRGYAWIDYSTFHNMAREGYVTIDIWTDRTASVRQPSVAARDGTMSSANPNTSTAAEGGEGVMGLPSLSGNESKVPTAAPPPARSTSRTVGQPKKLTPEVLTAAVRSTTKPTVLFNWEGNDIYPYSVWIELPEELAEQIKRAEYWFNHPSFTNPKRSIKGSNIYIAKWRGYGCISNAKVIVHLKSGGKLEAPFDLCAAQRKY